jgi:hypothetical protein
MGLKSLFVRTRYRRIARLRRNRWRDRITYQLMLAEDQELNPQRKTDYRQASIIVLLAAKNDPHPLVTSSYICFGTHPDKVFVKQTADRRAKLGREYDRWFDAAGNLIPEWLDIPDYDPTSELAAHWPGGRGITLSPLGAQTSAVALSLGGESAAIVVPRTTKKCYNCDYPAVAGKTRCEHHLVRAQEAHKRSRATKRQCRKCYDCGDPAIAGKTRCERHLAREQEAHRRHRELLAAVKATRFPSQPDC